MTGAFEPPVALTRRQELFYTDRADLYRPVHDRDPTSGTYRGKRYEPEALAVPCYFEVRSSVETAQLFGRIEGDNMFTVDTVHLDGEQEIDSGWVLVNRTLDADGAPSRNYGRYWIVQGQPKSVSNRGRRTARKRSVEAIQVSRKPEGLDLV